MAACPFVLLSLLFYLGPTPSFVFWSLAYLLLLVWAVTVYFIGSNSEPVIVLGILIIPLAFFFQMVSD